MAASDEAVSDRLTAYTEFYLRKEVVICQDQNPQDTD